MVSKICQFTAKKKEKMPLKQLFSCEKVSLESTSSQLISSFLYQSFNMATFVFSLENVSSLYRQKK